jgi:lysophospholipase L1-like esterase
MPRLLVAFVVSALGVALVRGADSGTVIDSMEQISFKATGDKAKLELVEGKVGKALQFSFANDCRGVFCTSRIRGTPAWDEAAGFSFWVRGDGSAHFGGLQFIYDDDFAIRYDYMFPIKSKEWTKITVAWRDLVPVLPGDKARLLDPQKGNKPSKLSALWVGKWWYWRDYAAHSFALDELCLEKTIDADRNNYLPAGAPLARTLAKLKAGKPVTIVTMGDSLTDTHHWANRQVNWPALLQKQAKEKYKSEVTIVNPAIGGTQLRQNLVLLPRWLEQAPEPDLVTVCFGGNDWESGMRGPQFTETCQDAIDRIRRATKGKADVLLLTTVPSVGNWTTMAELAEACRKAAQARQAGLADLEKSFHAEGKDNKERLYCSDKVHLGAPGHELVARTVIEAVEKAAGK